jgi:hypothetical protein
VRADIQEGIHAAIDSFIASPAGWNASAAELCEIEWESIAPLFDGFKR